MTESEAAQWLHKSGLSPVLLGLHGDGPECRWYPAAGSNLTGTFFDDCRHCLLPLAVYEALEFPKPPGWEDKSYPWFPSLEAAMLAAAKAVQLVVGQGKLDRSGLAADPCRFDTMRVVG